MRVVGDGNTYMMDKPYPLYLGDNGIQLTMKESRSQMEMHCNFEEVFGGPQTNAEYMVSIPFPRNAKFNIQYSYQTIKESHQTTSRQVSQLQSFSADT
jgi:hypothetical protein